MSSSDAPSAKLGGGKARQRNIRTKKAGAEEEDREDGPSTSQAVEPGAQQQADEVSRDKLEQIKLLQRVRKRAPGTAADALARAASAGGGSDGEGHVADLLPTELMGGFSKAKSVATTDEDPNMEKFVEQELARRLGRRADGEEAEDPEAKRRRQELELYQIPDKYKTDLVGDTVVPGMTTIMTEVAVSSSVKLRNIEEVETMKKRLLGRDEDAGPAGKEGGAQRRQFVPSFGKQRTKGNLDHAAAEEQRRRMKYVSERRPAVPTHRLSNP